MKSWRDRYFEDYTVEKVPASNRKGYKIIYTYTGNWFGWDLSPAELKKRRITYAAVAAAVTVLFAVCGTRSAYVNASAFVAVPGILSIIAQMYGWIGIFQFCTAKKMIREKEIRRTQKYLRAATVLTAICHGLAAVSCVILMALMGFEAPSAFVAFGLFACGMSSAALYRYSKSLSVVKLLEPVIEFDEMPY